MPTRDLMSKALELVRKNGAGAALVIMPLTMALPTNADSVPFTVGTPTITAGSSGGSSADIPYGTVEATPGTIVHLFGTTDPPPGSTDLRANLAKSTAGFIEFYWSGGFDPVVFQSGNALSLDYRFCISGTAVAGGDPGLLSWSLTAKIYDDATNVNTLATFNAAGQDFDNATGSTRTPISLVPDVAPVSWYVELDVTWTDPLIIPQNASTAINAGDTLQFDPSIHMSIQPPNNPAFGGGGVPAPLPTTLWMSGILVTGVSLLLIRQSLKPLPTG